MRRKSHSIRAVSLYFMQQLPRTIAEKCDGMRYEKKAEQEENYYFLGFIAFSKFKFVCAQKWQVVQKRSFCMRNPEQMTAFECISYLKAFPFPDEFTRLRRQLRRLLCCIMRNQFQLFSLFCFRTFGLLTFTCCTFHLQSSTTPQHYTYTRSQFALPFIFDIRFRSLIFIRKF